MLKWNILVSQKESIFLLYAAIIMVSVDYIILRVYIPIANYVVLDGREIIFLS